MYTFIFIESCQIEKLKRQPKSWFLCGKKYRTLNGHLGVACCKMQIRSNRSRFCGKKALCRFQSCSSNLERFRVLSHRTRPSIFADELRMCVKIDYWLFDRVSRCDRDATSPHGLRGKVHTAILEKKTSRCMRWGSTVVRRIALVAKCKVWVPYSCCFNFLIEIRSFWS